MDPEIWVAIIGAVATIAGVIVTTIVASNKTSHSIEVTQAVMNDKIENLTKEVAKHNDFASKIPVIDNRVKTVEREIKDLKAEAKKA